MSREPGRWHHLRTPSGLRPPNRPVGEEGQEHDAAGGMRKQQRTEHSTISSLKRGCTLARRRRPGSAPRGGQWGQCTPQQERALSASPSGTEARERETPGVHRVPCPPVPTGQAEPAAMAALCDQDTGQRLREAPAGMQAPS